MVPEIQVSAPLPGLNLPGAELPEASKKPLIAPKSHAPVATSIPAHLVPTAAATAKSLQSCLTLCDPIDGIPPGSPVPGIPQARILEWIAISFSNARK